MGIFAKLVEWISHSKFYVNYVCQWPAPFNIVSFDAVLLIIFLVIIIKAIWDQVNNYRYAIKFRAKQQKLQEERLENEIKERELIKQREEDNDIIRQYLKFLSMASAHNLLGTGAVSLEEFKEAFNAEDASETPIEETSVSTEGDAADDTNGDDGEELMHMPEPADVPEEEPKIPQAEEEREEEPDIVFDPEADFEPEEDPIFDIEEDLPDEIEESEEDVPDEKEDDISIEDILKKNGIDPAKQEEIKDEPEMEMSEFVRIMESITRNEAAKNEAVDRENKKREIVEKNIDVLNHKVENTIKENDPPASVTKANVNDKELEARQKEAIKASERENAETKKKSKMSLFRKKTG